ncbi:MAG: hypothetical protein JSS27_00685 [Planctomycetes bacterium]|nr:hypothetical protein [Planctomycetota bacterium]
MASHDDDDDDLEETTSEPAAEGAAPVRRPPIISEPDARNDIEEFEVAEFDEEFDEDYEADDSDFRDFEEQLNAPEKADTATGEEDEDGADFEDEEDF